MPSTVSSTLLFQSTRPVWGATERRFVIGAQRHVSIHAPRVGRDFCPGRHLVHDGRFQSTRPVWGATGLVITTIQRLLFQSTRPVWGATKVGSSFLIASHVSIHAPRVGRDRQRSSISRQLLVFQSTRPVWGATRDRHRPKLPAPRFNPRAPCGARRA